MDKLSEELETAESLVLEEELQIAVELATQVQAEREESRRRAKRTYSSRLEQGPS